MKFNENWNEYILYNLANWKNGLAFKDINFSEKGKPIIKIAELKNGITQQTKYTNGNYGEEVYLKRDDLIFSWSGNPQTSIDAFLYDLPEGYLNQHSFKVTENKEIIDKYFLYYILKYLKPLFQNIATDKQTTGLGHVTVADLKRIKVRVPSLEIQYKILNVIKRIDNKIYLNNKINNNLKEITNKLYEQLFIKERQETWNEYNFRELADCYNGYSYTGKELAENSNIGMATIKNFERKSGFKEDGFKAIEPIKAKDVHFAKKFDILVACTDLTQNADIIGNAIMLLNTGNYKDIVISMDLVKIIPKRNKYLIYSILNSAEFKNFALGYKTGTTVLHLNKDCLKDFNIKLPDSNIMDDFEKVAEINYKKISSNLEENNTLINLRDTLLPKLMNGEIELDKIEI